jgi:hypothetical protein
MTLWDMIIIDIEVTTPGVIDQEEGNKVLSILPFYLFHHPRMANNWVR